MDSSTPLTVCIFTSFYPPIQSGSATHCADLSKELTKYGCKVVVITSNLNANSQEFEIRDGVHVYRLPAIRLPKTPIALNFPWLNISFFPSNTRRILNIMKIHSPNVIHLHNHMFDSAFHAVKIAKKTNTPLVITVHTMIKHTNFFFDLILRFIDKFILKFLIVQKADMVICPDHIIQKYVTQNFVVEKNTIIPYGITPLPEPNLQKMQAIRKKYNIGDGPVILSLGHLHETRNRKELISILPALLEQFPTLKVVIAGYIGTDSTSRLAAKLGVSDHLILTGVVPYSDIQEYFGIAQIEAHWFDEQHPHKTLGIAAQEAMSAGKVVIGNADENVYGEGVLQNGNNVILISPGNANELLGKITELLIDDKKRAYIENNARQTIQNYFNWDVVCQKTVAAYEMARINKINSKTI